MNNTFHFIADIGKRLGRPINDLGDVRLVVDTLCELRLKEIDVDMSVGPIEVCFIVAVIGYFVVITYTVLYRLSHYADFVFLRRELARAFYLTKSL